MLKVSNVQNLQKDVRKNITEKEKKKHSHTQM